MLKSPSLNLSPLKGIILCCGRHAFQGPDLYCLPGQFRGGYRPFTVMTGIFNVAARASRDRLVVVNRFGELYNELGLFRRMAERVMLKYGMVWDLPYETVFERLAELRATQYPQALDHEVRNFCGHAGRARVLFVGEQINPVYKRFRHWPFHADRGCTVYLAQCLDKFGFDEEQAVWTNILHEQESHVISLLNFNPQLKVIALGKKAVNGLKALGVTPHAELPHPQFAKRFLSKTFDYSKALQEAVSS